MIRNDEVGDHGQGPDEQSRVKGRQGNLGPQRIHSKRLKRLRLVEKKLLEKEHSAITFL